MFISLIAVVLSSCLSCLEKDDRPQKEPQEAPLDSAVLSFAFSEAKRYSYCPVVLEQQNGDRYMYFCGNPAVEGPHPIDEIIIDNVYLYVERPDGSSVKEKSVLRPGASGWDSHHCCDPSVIEGEFRMDGTTYKYAMFYTGSRTGRYYCELGVAFSNDLCADSWVKYPGPLVPKTWEGDDDLPWSGGLCWGVGQPSAVSLDKKGDVLLTYSVGDLNGTRVMCCRLDMSDMDNFERSTPKTMIIRGLNGLDGKLDYCCDIDLAINQEENVAVIVRPVQPLPTVYPAYIPTTQEVDYMKLDDFLSGRGSWTPIGRIGPEMTGFQRNHNAGLLRDNFGHIRDWKTPTVYFAVSDTSPQVFPVPDRMAEWTYDIYKVTLSGLGE